MHLSDALISPEVALGVGFGTVSLLAYSSRQIANSSDEKLFPLIGLMGAFVFAAQMVNFTIPGTGASGHIGGGILLAAILGSYGSFLAIASILTVQALFFADGGILALGANIWNLGFYTSFIAYPLIYKKLIVTGKESRARLILASLFSVVIGLQLGSFSLVIETVLSGRSELSLVPFLILMQPIHLLIGIIEGIITAAVLGYIKTARPDILDIDSDFHRKTGFGSFGVALAFSALLIGGFVSIFASEYPDGLEWSVGKLLQSDPVIDKDDLSASANILQEKSSILPDYSFRNNDSLPQAEQKLGKSISGLIGSLLVFLCIIVVGIGMRFFRARFG